VACTLTATAQVSMQSAIDLARRNSAQVRMAQSDLAHAEGALSETKDAYLPSIVGTSSVCCYTYGFPVGQPTLFDFQAQSLVFSFSQPDYIRAAKAGVQSAKLALKNAVNQVEFDAATDYLQLDTISKQLVALDELKTYAAQLDTVEQDRVGAGIQTQIAATQAELNAEQADLKRLDLQAEAATLREKLANLTGLYGDLIQTEPASIPGEPMNLDANLGGRAPGIDASVADAKSKAYLAHGDGRATDRPQVSFGMNYARYSTFNNYQDYYLRFQHNNFDIGLQVSIPVFDASAHAKARQSAAAAVHATQQAELNREQAGEQVVNLDKHLPELRAQARIADLQAQLAAEKLQAVQEQEKSAPASPNAQAVTPADELLAHIEERSRYSDALDAHFTLLKTELSLLLATDRLSEWLELAQQ
jgi:outer membrane protein TolC